MRCVRCGDEARIALVKDEQAWAEHAYCQPCWELEELIYRISELTKQAGLSEEDHPEVFRALSRLRDQWELAREGARDEGRGTA